MECIQLAGRILRGNLSLVNGEKVVSLSHTKVVYRIFKFCVMRLKDEREPTIKKCTGKQDDVVQEFIRIQSFGHNWWWANGIRVEYVQRHLIGDLKDNQQECALSAQLVSIFSRRFAPGKWSFLGPGSKKWLFYWRIQTTRRMGQSCWANDDKICRGRTPSFPIHESIVMRNAQK